MPSIRSLLSVLLAAGSGVMASKDSIVAYYGQCDNQPRLAEYCLRPEIDIIPIGFVTKFANNGKGGVMETNFGNSCDPPAYPGTNFFHKCPYLEKDIITCQKAGKKILLSIGGGKEGYYLASDQDAYKAADDIWRAFGPQDPSWKYGRPFGKAIVDGFDLDLETGAEYGGNGETYKTFAQALRDKFARDKKKKGGYILSAAPLCTFPNPNLGKVIQNVELDHVFVQYYNEPRCSPTNLLSDDRWTSGKQLANFEAWNALAQMNPGEGNTTFYMGLLYDRSSPDYVTQLDLHTILGEVQPMSQFGGIMMWGAGQTPYNPPKNTDGQDYIACVSESLSNGTYVPEEPTNTLAPEDNPGGEVQDGITANCEGYATPYPNQDCYAFATALNITTKQLIVWNPVLNGTGCKTSFQTGSWYCVDASSESYIKSASVKQVDNTIPMETNTTSTTTPVPQSSSQASTAPIKIPALAAALSVAFVTLMIVL